MVDVKNESMVSAKLMLMMMSMTQEIDTLDDSEYRNKLLGWCLASTNVLNRINDEQLKIWKEQTPEDNIDTSGLS